MRGSSIEGAGSSEHHGVAVFVANKICLYVSAVLFSAASGLWTDRNFTNEKGVKILLILCTENFSWCSCVLAVCLRHRCI